MTGGNREAREAWMAARLAWPETEPGLTRGSDGLASRRREPSWVRIAKANHCATDEGNTPLAECFRTALTAPRLPLHLRPQPDWRPPLLLDDASFPASPPRHGQQKSMGVRPWLDRAPKGRKERGNFWRRPRQPTLGETKQRDITMVATKRMIAGACVRSAKTPDLGAVDWLCLAATPSFAMLALLTIVFGGTPQMLCSPMQDGSALSGMVPMYLLMSTFHSAPWLKLISHWRKRSYRFQSGVRQFERKPNK